MPVTGTGSKRSTELHLITWKRKQVRILDKIIILNKSVNVTILKTTAGLANLAVVNSQFTAGIFRDTFRSLQQQPQVLYPSLNFQTFDRPCNTNLDDVIGSDKQPDFVFLSINRYERKKNLGLAIKALGNNHLSD